MMGSNELRRRIMEIDNQIEEWERMKWSPKTGQVVKVEFCS